MIQLGTYEGIERLELYSLCGKPAEYIRATDDRVNATATASGFSKGLRQRGRSRCHADEGCDVNRLPHIGWEIGIRIFHEHVDHHWPAAVATACVTLHT